MIEEFECFTSHEYESEDFDEPTKDKSVHLKDQECSEEETDKDNKVKDLNLMSKEKRRKVKKMNEEKDQI